MPRLLSPDSVVGRYRLADFLGAGGMGEVYRATHLASGQVVAIKVLSSAEIEASWLARFYHEARVQQGLDHPNIVRLHELVDVGGRPCLVMEYVGGESLADQLERERRLDPRAALRVLWTIAGAVAYVHHHGIVHRDLKPGNIRVTPDGSIKLLDFGISKSRHAEGLTQVGNVIGTPRYLSPEQLMGHPVTPAADVWALGVLLYELVTGTPPFGGTTDAQLWTRIESGAYVAASSVAPPAPENTIVMRQIDRLVASCLNRDPAKRPTAAALATATSEAIAAGARAVARPVAAIGAGAISGVADLGTPAAAPTAMQAWLERWWLPITAVSAAAALFLLALYLAFDSRLPSAGGGAVAVAADSDTATPGGKAPAEPGVHHIDVITGRAAVLVNGKPIGETPVDYVGPVGETVSVELRQPGFEPVKEQIEVSTTGTSTFMMHRTGERP
jgi:eukaryotic-like serine/threonine-protein kinase